VLTAKNMLECQTKKVQFYFLRQEIDRVILD